MSDFSLAAGDTAPALTATLSDDGVIQDLTGATVNLVVRNSDATTDVINSACTVTDATAGKVSYAWQTGDTDTPGEYVFSFEVTFSDATIKYFPTQGYKTLTITPSLTGSAKPRPSFFTTSNAISQARTFLDGKVRAGRNKLASAISATDESLTLTYTTGGAAAGTPITVGLETMYVWTASGQTLTVERGSDGTVPSQHAAGDIVLIDPEFTDAKILDAINLVLSALPSAGVYATKTLDLSVSGSSEGYDLAADVESVLDVRWQHSVDSTDWTPIQGFEVKRNMPTTSFASGVALFLPERPGGWFGSDTHAVRVTYRAVLQPLQGLFDDVVAVTGLPASALDLLSLGAACWLMTGRPIQRVGTNAQPDPRNNAEVPVSAVLNSTGRLEQRFAQRIADEADKLSRENVYRQPNRRLNATAGFRRRWR